MKVRLILKGASSSLTVKRRPLGDPSGNFEKWYTPWSSTLNLKTAPLEKEIHFFFESIIFRFYVKLWGCKFGFWGDDVTLVCLYPPFNCNNAPIARKVVILQTSQTKMWNSLVRMVWQVFTAQKSTGQSFPAIPTKWGYKQHVKGVGIGWIGLDPHVPNHSKKHHKGMCFVPKYSAWWFQIFLFSPLLGERIHFG